MYALWLLKVMSVALKKGLNSGNCFSLTLRMLFARNLYSNAREFIVIFCLYKLFL